jgi:hypothetical protein
MMFLLRCAFWLGLTFAFLDWPDGAPPAPDPQALAQMAAQEIAGRCAAYTSDAARTFASASSDAAPT